MTRMCRSHNVGWVCFTVKRHGRVKEVHVAPVNMNAEPMPPHEITAQCVCHPKVEINENGGRTYTHDNPMTEAI
jgi:hypothetical protein